MSALPSPSALERVACVVANEAAELVRETIGSASAFATKSSTTDVVTRTDIAAEELIRKRLAQLTPGCAVIGEEKDDTSGSSGVGWIVDPIDGTVNFLYDLPVVSVSIAATLHEQVVAGAVVDVLRGETFSAYSGGGARRDGVSIAANRPDDLSQALIVTGFSYDPEIRRRQGQVISRLAAEARDIRCFGSAALQLCWVGCGRVDGYYETDLKSWDVAAGGLIAAEGGATVQLPQVRGGLTMATAGAVFDSLATVVGDGH